MIAMKAKYSRRDFLKFSLLGLGASYLAACQKILTPTPTYTVPPPPTKTSTPEPPDIPIYKNSFEGITDLAANGITSTKNDLRLNTETVDYQSGSQSLEAYGTIAGAQYSALTIDLSVKKLTGQDEIDLSNKQVSFNFFSPPDVPVDIIGIAAIEGTKIVVLSNFPNLDTGKWNKLLVDVKSIYGNNSWAYTDLSNDEAGQVVSHCQQIQIFGMRGTAGTDTPASFLIDDLSWIGIRDINHIVLDDSVDSIRKYANLKHLKIGVVMFPEWFDDPWYPYTLAQAFNMTTAGAMTPPETKPADISAMNFDYTTMDQMLAFAQGNGMFLRGGTGGYHLGQPRWVLDASYDELKAFLERKIELDIGHYGGRVYSWGVFNEPINDAGNGLRNRQQKNPNDPNAGAFNSSFMPYGGSYSPFVDGNDTSLIEAAFIKARQMDPNAMLYINEFDDEEIGRQKSDFFYNFLVKMRDKGVPIDGGGFECHKMFPQQPGRPETNLENLDAYLDRVDRNIKRYAAAGLKVEITEFECQIRFDDIDLATRAGRDELARRAQKQAELYVGFTKLAIENPNVLSFTIWTLADKAHMSAFEAPWYPSFTYTDSFLFDKNYNPKPAYTAVVNALKNP